ncbi:MAG TPA: hypothetical protein ENI91_07160 [Sphingomonadales bacterium]|nr:hypothetical protein [Sphingomonadales bacterium]
MDRRGGRRMTDIEYNDAYKEREQRVLDVIALKQPDRVPVFLYSTFWQARYAGMTCEEAMYDYERLSAAIKDSVLEFDPDSYALIHPAIALGPTMEIMGYQQLKWPGHEGVSPDVSFQYIDAEYMKAAEYDEYLDDPTGFYLRRYLPRIATAYEPLAKLPDFTSFFYTRLVHCTQSFADPKVIEAFETLARAGREANKMFAEMSRVGAEIKSLGYPLCQSASGGAPFDYFADYLRGSKKGMLDMFRNKDKLLAAMDAAAPRIARGIINSVGDNRCRIAFIPIHWGLDGFMSPEQFEIFFWPSLRKVIMLLIEADIIPNLLWEGDCTSRLEVIKDIPVGKCIYFFERTDLFKAKEILGETVCLRGNVPASMMTTGSPDDVTEYCRKLIDVVGKGGGFIMDSGVGIPDEAKTENVKAMFDTTKQYGIYG